MKSEKMTVEYEGKKYEVWVEDAVSDGDGKTFSAWAYSDETEHEKVGLVIWDTSDDYDGESEDDSYACDWDVYRFELTEMYANVGPKDLLARMKEVKIRID